MSKTKSLAKLLEVLVCPYSGLPLTLDGNVLNTPGRSYPIHEGIADLVLPERVAAIDKYFQRQYDEKTALAYDRTLKIQSLMLGCLESAQRKRLATLLNPSPGGLLLEVAVGTGANLRHLGKALGPDGEIVAVDLSLAMLRKAKTRVKKLPCQINLLRADGCYLPFADNTFDAVFHFGGINMFGGIGKALNEMVRVAKPQAPILVSDEGMSERRRKTKIGSFLGNSNSLNLCHPPFADLPWKAIYDFRLHWAWRELFYVLVFRKGQRSLKIVGKNIRDEIEQRIDR